jgi:chitodextrinase
VGLLQFAGSSDTSAAVSSDPVLLLAGDISQCSNSNDEATAKILDAHPDAIVQTLGDLVYENATASDFTNCYHPTWGRHKARTKPVPGNHEYNTSGATPYYNYFGAAAGSPGKGWYSYNIGAWHVVALNSNCSSVGGCSAGSPQELWLRADLAANSAPCTLAVWHHPRFSARLATSSVQAFWKALSDYKADVVLAGHSHHYERFTQLGPNGAVDTNGIRSFVVGTGGAGLHSGGSTTTGSQIRQNNTYGVVKLTLHPQGYDWAFLPVAGKTFTDSGSDTCRGLSTDGSPPTQPANLTATTPLGRVDLSWQASTDNVGVSGYDVLRNGALLATVGASATSYTDSTVAPSTTYSYTVRARDAAGNVSPLSNAAIATTPEPLTLRTYVAAADARVDGTTPSTNYGTASALGTDANRETYLRFDVSGLPGTVHSARLRLYSTNGSIDGPSVRTTTNDWVETALTWSNRPAPIGPVTDDRVAVPLNAYVEWDVTSSVQGDGTVSFVLSQPGADSSDFASREASANPPELIVAVNGGAPPTDTTPPTAPTALTAVPSPGRVALEWQPATDNVAVSGYEIFRNGARLVEVGAVTSYADTTVAPTTQYTYEVRALDAAGNRSQFSNSASATTPGTGQTQTFTPVADARVEQANAATNYGTSTTLRTVGGSAVESHLHFNVGVLPAAVQSAKLRLYVSNGTVDGPAVYGSGEVGWTETSLTWANRPAPQTPASDDRAALGTGYAEWDVTSLINAIEPGAGHPSGQVALVLSQTNSDGTTFNSKEAATNKPQLVVTLSGTQPPPDTTPPSKPVGVTANAVAGRVDLGWQAATDDVAVTGYDIVRNGNPLVSVGAVTTYADTSVAPNTSYTYTVRARDAAGNSSPFSDPVTVTTPAAPPAPQTVTFSPIADSRVEAATPSTNFGTNPLIGVDFSPDVDAYLTFNVSGLSGTVQSARLRLYAPNGSVDGPAVYQTTPGWGEMTLNWSNRPEPLGAPSDDRVAVPKNAWSEWNVTSFVAGNGTVSFLLSQPGTDGADFHSREATAIDLRPQLVVTTAP